MGAVRLALGPRDLCPLGHGPMWWWPTGGTWACQLPTCEITTPVYACQVVDALRYSMRAAMWARPLVTSPKAFPFPISTA